MTVQEVADFLRVSVNTVRAMTSRGEMNCFRIGGRKERRFAKRELETYLANRSQSKPAAVTRDDPFVARDALSELSPTAVLNRGLLVHDWYMMPEAFSEPLVVEAMERFGTERGDTVLDPFSGTGTTVITAALRGCNGVGIEVNPFLCFASRVKLDWAVDADEFANALRSILDVASPLLESVSSSNSLFAKRADPAVERLLSSIPEPEMPRLHKWMSPPVVRKVLLLRSVIDRLAPVRLRGHFQLALAATLRPASNMKLAPHAFGSSTVKEDAPVYDLFREKAGRMLDDLRYLDAVRHETGRAEVLHADARQAGSVASNLLPAALAVTSPPYLNNLDYTMQTRLELFFLKFVENMADLREVRKSMVTSDAKAQYKDVLDSQEVSDVTSIQKVAAALHDAHRGKNWGWNYSFMTTQYFGGMSKVLRSVKGLLTRNARFAIVVGESAHSGVKVPVPDIVAELGERAGYSCEEVSVIRRRRSSSHSFELCESEVLLRRR